MTRTQTVTFDPDLGLEQNPFPDPPVFSPETTTRAMMTRSETMTVDRSRAAAGFGSGELTGRGVARRDWRFCSFQKSLADDDDGGPKCERRSSFPRR